jgi:hypothetical protein
MVVAAYGTEPSLPGRTWRHAVSEPPHGHHHRRRTPRRPRRGTSVNWANIRCYTEHGRCYTLDLGQVDPGQPGIREMITISDPAVEADPAFAVAALPESCAEPAPAIPWDQIKVEA